MYTVRQIIFAILCDYCWLYFVLSEEVHARYKDILQAEYDRVIDQCMEEVNSVKVSYSVDQNGWKSLLKTGKLQLIDSVVL